MSAEANSPATAAEQARAWKERHRNQAARAEAAHQRDLAALTRSQAAGIRDHAAQIRADAARVRDDGARARDDAARVRDSAARMRDLAARSREEALHAREQSMRARLAASAPLDAAAWKQVLDLDRSAAEHGAMAASRDRDAAELDRTAADKDREAADRDRVAAARDRDAADRDREAAEQDRHAAEVDRSAAESDRGLAEEDLRLGERWIARLDQLASLGRVAAGVAHEVNNPLTALMATLDMLREEFGDGRSQELATRGLPLVEDAMLAAQRIRDVVNDVRFWMGRGQPEPTSTLDVRQLVEDAVRLTSVEVRKVADLKVELADGLNVVGAAGRLGQLLTNLLLNAAHASPAAARASNQVRVSARADGNQVVLEVADSGVGIHADVLPHIFDPFFTTREGGTGLGLAMCLRIVDEHHGTISVRSQEGAGTTFTIRLPVTDAPVGAPVLSTP